MASRPSIAGDRLYGISMRPQELALYGAKVAFDLRYSAVFDDPAEQTTEHFKLLVLEIEAETPADDPLGQARGRLQLLKCGWELRLTTPAACTVGTTEELAEEVPLLLARIADTINDLAQRGGLEAPMGPELVADLLQRYRLGVVGASN